MTEGAEPGKGFSFLCKTFINKKNIKRSKISPDKLEQLRGAVYTISCRDEDYNCTHKNSYCDKGFFSLYLQVIYGIHFAKKFGIPYQVDFSSLAYSYTDLSAKGGSHNFWDYYFMQPPVDLSKAVLNRTFENYPLKIWDRDFIRTLHREAFCEIRLQKDLQLEIEAIRASFKKHKTLGVHIRKTDHYREVKPAGDRRYFQLIKKHIAGFDRLFVATDDQEILESLQDIYKDRIIAHLFYRSSGGKALHEDPGRGRGYELGRQAMLDCYSLAACDKVILSPSNLSYVALLIHPELDYLLAESSEAKWNRWKTRLAYLLDKWGIRKW